MSNVAALIVAAGRSRRFGGHVPKVFVDLAGSPVLLRAVRAYDDCEPVTRLLLAVAEEHMAAAVDLCDGAGLAKPISLVAGGARRQDTVLNGLRALAESPPDIIAIHDGARPLIDRDTILRSIDAARRHGACVTATPVTDTIKQAGDDGVVSATPDRRALWRAQTPQTFRFELLRDCYRRAVEEGWEVTDDASVVERCGHAVRINPGPEANMKITTTDDLRHAEGLLGRSSAARPPALRVGHGFDVHALSAGRRLIIGGVRIPHPTGLQGHSDADVLLHAICDALLGAVAAGDIGALFPDSDPRFEGMDSAEFCRQVAEHIRKMGCEIGNIDATVIAQRPKLAPHIPDMRRNIANALGIDVSRVSVKATTTEGLGFAGREEGIAAEAVALVSGSP